MNKECTCVSCNACGGSGNIWLDFKGRYLGNHRNDDLDQMETCDECHGMGLSEVCEACTDICSDEEDARGPVIDDGGVEVIEALGGFPNE